MKWDVTLAHCHPRTAELAWLEDQSVSAQEVLKQFVRHIRAQGPVSECR
jgi:hypothetical protein